MVFVSVGSTCVGIFTFHRVQKLSMTGVGDGGEIYIKIKTVYILQYVPLCLRQNGFDSSRTSLNMEDE